MKRSLLIPASVIAFAACASASPTPTRTPPPAPRPQSAAPPPATSQTPPAPPPPATPAVREAPGNWHLLDATADQIPGISSERAMNELLANRQPKRTVVVAVIDGGVDTAHVDLRPNLWKNEKEVAGNNRDDDGNGYVDDVHGWNFIGGSGGESVRWDTFEVTRLHAQCLKAEQAGTQSAADRERCSEAAAEFEERRSEAEQTLQQIAMIDGALSQALPLLRQAVAPDSLSVERVSALQATGSLAQAKMIFLQLAQAGISPDVIVEAKEAYSSQLEYGLDPDFDPRGIVGDDYANIAERRYGNNDVMGPDAKHGTHVAGIIGAVRGNGVGIDGIAPAVRLMVIRTVPDGDERDKDVANAIRYAVDNGANVINMSFGKSFSPGKAAVDEAVKYADSKGVLLVHAAGNDGEDLSVNRNYPTPFLTDGARAQNWIEVGASSWRGIDSLAAPFSNWGSGQVDVFAPGEDVLSTVPGSEYKREDGTSMAAPVVSGLAALIMSHHPELTAADVKRIILETASPYREQMVVRPGSPDGEKVRFGTLSATGGIVNALAALRRAEEVAATKRPVG